jgi:hypothetical protein
VIDQHTKGGIMYYYYNIATGEYTGCGNESTAPAGCEAKTTPPEPAPKTNDEIIAELTSALESHYDAVAQERRYDNRLTCALRAGYVGPFQAEGQAFAVWMDTCNAYGYQVMQDVLAKLRPVPTAEELIAELPVMIWPA